MKYISEAWESAPDETKYKTISEELRLITHNGLTKDDLLMMLRWIFDQYNKINNFEQSQCAKLLAERGQLIDMAGNWKEAADQYHAERNELQAQLSEYEHELHTYQTTIVPELKEQLQRLEKSLSYFE